MDLGFIFPDQTWTRSSKKISAIKKKERLCTFRGSNQNTVLPAVQKTGYLGERIGRNRLFTREPSQVKSETFDSQNSQGYALVGI
jgi:hypothetical protein